MKNTPGSFFKQGMRFRKRQPTNETNHEAISTRLREAVADLGDGNYEPALRKLDTLAGAAALSADRKCQIAALAAQALLDQGKFSQAAETFQKAWTLGRQTPQAWFGAALGRVTALLRHVEVEEAFATAKTVLDQAEQKARQRASLPTSAALALARSGSVQVNPAPIRPSVAAFRLGQQFWEEGEPDKAKWFFTRATQVEPQGACRARIGLARIALARDDATLAYDLARQALTLGRFHNKTLSAWPVLIAAARGLGKTGIEPPLAGGLAQAPPTVRGRARLLIARDLRAYGDPAWISFASAGKGEDRHHILRAEFAKIRAASSPALAPAETLLATPNLSPLEWLAAAKAAVARRLAADRNPAIERTLAAGLALHGDSFAPTARHGLALACAKAQRADLAIKLLEDTADPKSRWLRARLLRDAGKLSAAADAFRAISSNADVPERFRLLATLEWMRCIAQVADETALGDAAAQLAAAAASIQDYELLLDLARQLTQSPSAAADYAETFFARGQALALERFAAAEHPGTALEILFKLSRRQADFGKYTDIVQGWETLSARQRDWLWSLGSTFWEYLAIVTTALRACGNHLGAEALCARYLDDPATPPSGLAELGIPLAVSLLHRGQRTEAFEWFEWLAWKAPTHPLCAYAHYWLALRAEKSGQPVEPHLTALSLALGSSAGMAWMRSLDTRRRLLEGNSIPHIADHSDHTEDDLTAQLEELENDRALL